MLPIAVLPVAGLLLGIGSSFTNATMIDTYGLQAILGEGTILNMFLTVLSKAGSALFDNLPIIFAAVSYTHLDVYKRQALNCPRINML